jgi:biotin carboxyl carrier protein
MAMEIRSEVPGTVMRLEVSEGARVAAGETLMLLESMKMEIPVDSPRAGTVARVMVRESDVIDTGQVLLVLG